AERLAVQLAGFNRALAAVDPAGCPIAGSQGGPQRGIPIRLRDEQVRSCVVELADELDPAPLLAAWEADAFVADHDGDPVWVHGDLTPGNLLWSNGKLAGVLDFGGVAVGDPAVGLLPAWNLLDGSARRAFREASGADEARWRRGRAWALSIAVVALPYYRDTHPAICESSRRVLTEVLAEHERDALGPAALPFDRSDVFDVDPSVGTLVDGRFVADPPSPRRGTPSFGIGVRPANDVVEAAWVRTGQARGQSDAAYGVGQLVPEGFERVLFVDDVPGDQDDWWELEKAHTMAIADVAARHTTTPDRVFFAIWEGHGYDERGVDHVLRFASGDRTQEYFLLEGSLSGLADLVWPNDAPTRWLQPDLWWPADRAWVVCTDVDLACNYVAGPQALIDDVVGAVTTETRLVERDDPFERV
ncbi:MAG: phosphotransferase, partial [Acidimicrobiales bacterium]|nr:phosphotransferase [Acidimicrobiales bacterium]